MQQYDYWHEDRSAAGNGIEARVPFLDHRLIELVAAVPEALRPRLIWDVPAAVAHAAPEIPEGSRVVALSPDFGDRYTHTVYNDDWVTRKFGPETVSIGELADQTGR
ncbi:asparagine synthase-related protein [Streptomyces sp. Ac-502]|uniref:asparagine synthase-related protein n=1 Tax=Streptomyces sp. Ac-502 TaxID=3342801 RepID=UPI003862AF76